MTTVANNAFANNKKLKSVTIGSNVTTVGSKALKGINKKAKIKVPKSCLKKYKKLFKGKGQNKSVKIVKK